jgi:uncharacterized membrane protein
MDMTIKYLAVYIAALVVFLIIDGIWLGLIARSFYVDQLGHLLRPSPNFGVAGLFYLFYVAGIVVFAVMPAMAQQSWRLCWVSSLTAHMTSPILQRLLDGRYLSLSWT